MKLYVAEIREGEEHFTTALVKDPAVEAKLVFFNSEEKKPTFFVNDEKRIVYSVAMRPNKKIFRKEIDGEPAEVYFTEETIEKFQQMYFKHQGQKLTNVNHTAEYLADVYPIESWIVKDTDNDKSNVIGLETMKGDLVMAFKVENDEVWEEVKKGNIDGLSIEAYLDYKQVNKNEKMSNSFTSAFKAFRKLFAEENQGLTIAIEGTSYNVTALEVGGLVTDTEGNPLENGTFEAEGKTYKTDNLGAIVEIAEPSEQMEDEEKKEEEKEEEPPTEIPIVEDVMKELAEVKEELQNVKAELVETKTELETMKKQTPKATVISRNPATKMNADKPISEMSNYERYLANRGKI